MTMIEVDLAVPVADRVNVKLLRKTLEWAHDQWHRWQRNEISEWEQGDWMVSTAQRYWDMSEEDFQALIDEGSICGTSCCVAGKVAYDLGYESPSAFITMFKKAFGKPPATYINDRLMAGG